MATAVGFKQLTIRVHDGEEPTVGKNLFVIKGDTDEGATSSAKISGLAVDPVKTYGSNKVYKISGKGVGDGKVDLDIIDIPEDCLSAILGYTVQENKIIRVTSDTQAPDCSILLEDSTPAAEKIMLGFVNGVFSYDGTEWGTTQGKSEELKAETISFAVGSNDAGDYLIKYIGSDAAAIDEIKADLGLSGGEIVPTIEVHDSTIKVGATWDPADNFDSATDSSGNDVPFDSSMTSDTVDTSVEGVTDVTYTFDSATAVAKVTVEAASVAKKATKKG
ncbi:major tail protein [Lactococcus garvieae]